MVCCLNPDCPNPLNPNGKKLCQSCSTPLIPLLRNRFRVMRVLSDEGGFGKTYLAEDVDKLNELCVIKQLAPKFEGNWALKKAVELFEKEAERLQQLGEHPQIPTLLAYFQQDNYLYLVQQFIDGHNLLKELQQRLIYSGSDIEQLLLNLLPVLKFVHERGVIHRDIKPQNIIRRSLQPPLDKGARGDLVLIDFGSSKQLTAKVQLKMGTAIGSHGYCPIEQIRDGTAYPASDLFSVGATCFHLLTGISPFQLWMENGYAWMKDWRQYLREPVSDKLAGVLDKLLYKDMQQRYQSASEVLNDLAGFSAPLPPKATPIILRATPGTASPRNHSILKNFLIVGIGILVLGLGEFWYSQSRHQDTLSSSIREENNPPSKNQPSQPVQEKFSLANTLKADSNSVMSLAVSPNGQTLVSNSDNNIKLWNLTTAEEISTLKGHDRQVNVLAISPNGESLVSGSEDNTIKLWNLATGQEIRTFRGHSNSIHALAISKDSKIVVDGSDDNTIKVWNLETGKEISTLRGHLAAVRSLAISPDGQTLASGSFDRTIKLWNLKTAKKIRTLRGHIDKVTSVVISSDGNTLVSGSFDKTIKLWNLSTGKQIRTFRGHFGKVTSLAISPDGNTLASSSSDRTIKLWNLSTGKQIRTMAAHSNGVQSVAFSLDGKTLVTRNDDSTIKIWRISR